MRAYGTMLINGDGIPKKKKEGIRYLKMAVDHEDVLAMLNYGLILINGGFGICECG